MSKIKTKTHHLLAGAIALSFGGAALAGGPVGTVPYDGDGSGAGFTILNAAFDFNDVTAAPCPDGATCVSMSATTAGSLLMREVDTGAQRFIQMIIVDPDSGNGDFTYEATVSAGGDGDTFGGLVVLDDSANEFYSTQALYRGALFGASGGNNSLDVEVHQSLSGGFQTFDMETLATPNQGAASLLRDGRIQIVQGGTGNTQKFGHTIVAGNYQTVAGTLTAGDESITFASGQAVSATWIGGTMSGGGPGPAGNHDARPAELRDFGLLIYRTNNNASLPGGNAGGTPAGLVDPQFTQGAVAQTARAFSGPDPLLQNSGDMYNLDHGSFIGGAAILAGDWDDTVFGDHPY